MSFELMTKHEEHVTRPSWANVAFIVEAMLLLVFLIASLAVFMQLFSLAIEKSQDSGHLTDAVAAASTTAERFAAEPDSVPAVSKVNGLTVKCDVTPTKHDRGTVFTANIAVYLGNDTTGEPIYTVTTSSYESGVL